MYPERFCENESINILVDEIEKKMKVLLPQMPKLKDYKKNYSVWEHVPKLGKRLEMVYSFEQAEGLIVSSTNTYHGLGTEKISELMEYEDLEILAESMGLELDIAITPWLIFISTLERKKKS